MAGRTIIRNQEIIEKSVEMDEVVLIDCKLVRCSMIFRGGEIGVVRVVMDGCTQVYLEAAGNTVRLMLAFGWRPPEVQPTMMPEAPSGLPN